MEWHGSRLSLQLPRLGSRAHVFPPRSRRVRARSRYRRTDLLEKRRQLMEAWTTFCTAPEQKPNVTSLPIKACVLRHGGEGNAPNAAAQQPCCRCDFTVSQAEARNDGGKYHSRFDERAVERIRASLPKGIDQRRVDLLPRVLNEWSRTDLTEHLSRDPPAPSQRLFAHLTNVGGYQPPPTAGARSDCPARQVLDRL